jgi:CheY-like chemotaxis protein
VVVLDVALPKLDGLEVLRLLRSSSVTKDVPVIIMTALAGDHIRAQALAAGANAFLLKPCSPEELEVAIRKVLAAKPRP